MEKKDTDLEKIDKRNCIQKHSHKTEKSGKCTHNDFNSTYENYTLYLCTQYKLSKEIELRKTPLKTL